ncbi:TPA: helix-turn-helix domain-containing protein [Streptococcus pyogenes]
MSAKKTFFASNLKYLRLKKNMEQLELANLLGRKSSSSISEWEKGKYTPKSGLLSDIAAIFDVSLTALMEEDLTLESKGVSYQLPQRELVMISEQLSENNYTKWVDFAQILLEQQAKEDRELDNH